MINAAGDYQPFYDMCGHCKMNTGGGHQPYCPLYQPIATPPEPQVTINIKISNEKAKKSEELLR